MSTKMTARRQEVIAHIFRVDRPQLDLIKKSKVKGWVELTESRILVWVDPDSTSTKDARETVRVAEGAQVAGYAGGEYNQGFVISGPTVDIIDLLDLKLLKTDTKVVVKDVQA